MSENMTLTQTLGNKIDNILSQINESKSETEKLRTELTTAKAASEAKDARIEKLEEEMSMKDMELEDIIKKIESILPESV